MQTHLAIALSAASTGSSSRAIADRIGVAQSTISRLMSSDRRIDNDTLRALCTRLDAGAGTQILLGHLLDEITRAGRSTLDWSIAPRGPVDMGDLATLEAAVGGPEKLPEEVASEIRSMVHHLANMVRHYRTTTDESSAPALAAKSPQASYGIKSADIPHPLETALRAKAAGGMPKPPTGR